MIIRTINETYNVIRTVKTDNNITAYLCACEGQPKEGSFLVMKPNGQELSRKMLTYFMDLAKHGPKEDFVECFTKEGVVWVVFRYFEGTVLKEKLKEKLSVEERLFIGKNLIEHFLFQNMPDYLRFEAFRTENLVVDDSLFVHTNYLLFEPEQICDSTIQQVLRKLSICFKLLFDEELEEDMSQELYEFVKKLYSSEYMDEASAYRAYRDLEALLWQAHGEGQLRVRGYLTRCWEWIARHFVGACKLFYTVIVMGLIGIFLYVCVMPKTAPADRMLFESIGTLTIIKKNSPSLPENMGIPETEQKRPVEEDTEQLENTENNLPKDTKDRPSEAEMG